MAEKRQKMIVLGAGASIGSKRFPIRSSMDQIRDTMPSAENFFYDLFKRNKSDNLPEGSMNSLAVHYEQLNDLITMAWNINTDGFEPKEWKGVNIEEVMTFLEVSSNMHLDGSEEQMVCKKAQKYLLDFLNPFMPMICEDQHCEYLLDIFCTIDKKDTVISYNWDTIAEHTLEKISAVQLKNYAKLLRSESIKIKNFFDKGLLLKLHGSFNWMLCQDKQCDLYNKIIPPFKNKRYKLLTLRETWNCPSCKGGKLKSHIVPPVSNKMIHKDSFMKNQWLIAREKLLYAKEIVFIGYSFPPTDFYTDWLFRQLNFIVGRPKIKIIIVNPEYGKKNSIVTKRYNSLFKGHEIESYKTLKEYSKNIFNT